MDEEKPLSQKLQEIAEKLRYIPATYSLDEGDIDITLEAASLIKDEELTK